MTRTTLAVAADYADAMLIARFWKNLLFLLLLLLMMIQIGVFLGVRFYTTGTDSGVVISAGTTQPSYVSGTALSSGLFWLVNVTDFMAIIAVVVLAVVLLLIVGIMLVGRLIGVTHVTRAFILSVALGALLFPWQSLWNYPTAGTLQAEPSTQARLQVGPPIVVPGVLYTWPELQHRSHFPSEMSAVTYLGWARFVGWPVVAIILLFMIQTRSSRGLKYALGEAEVQVVESTPTTTTVTQTGV